MTIKRRTKSLEILLEFFEKTTSAVAVVELIERFKQKMNKTTIYRILDKLEQEGFLHSFMGKDGLTWYAKCHACSAENHADAHPHFQCQNCGKLECVSTEIPLPTLPNRKISFAQVLLVGECERCVSS